MHDKHYNIEEPYDAKVSSTVLEPSREGRPSLLRQPRVCHAHVGQGCTTTGSAHAYNQILCMHYGFCLIYRVNVWSRWTSRLQRKSVSPYLLLSHRANRTVVRKFCLYTSFGRYSQRAHAGATIADTR